jgi:hypothetical protein
MTSLQLNQYEAELFSFDLKMRGNENWGLNVKIGFSHLMHIPRIGFKSNRIMTSRMLTVQILVSCHLCVVSMFVLLQS